MDTKTAFDRVNPLVLGTAIVLALISGIFLSMKLNAFNRHRRAEQEYKSLSLEYLNPNYSREYRDYWGIDDFDDYKKALRQKWEIGNFQTGEVSYGETEKELIHFSRLRMINWLDGQMIERAECLLRFGRRSNEEIGPYSIDFVPLSEEQFKEKVF